MSKGSRGTAPNSAIQYIILNTKQLKKQQFKRVISILFKLKYGKIYIIYTKHHLSELNVWIIDSTSFPITRDDVVGLDPGIACTSPHLESQVYRTSWWVSHVKHYPIGSSHRPPFFAILLNQKNKNKNKDKKIIKPPSIFLFKLYRISTMQV